MTAKAIVTGGNGYVGNALVRELVRLGVEVHAIANRNSDKLSVMLPAEHIHPIGNDWGAIEALVRDLEPDVIYHLAAVHFEPPTLDEMIATLNSEITLGATLLHGASLCETHPAFINLGTYWQFGDAAYDHAPNTFYAAAKQAMHDILIYFRNLRDIPAVTLVIYDIFGPDDPRPKLWTKLAQAEAGSTFRVTEGRQLIELVHVDDVIRAILFAADGLTQGESMEPIYSVGSMQRVTLRSLLEAVRKRAGLDIQFEWGAVPYQAKQIFTPWRGECLPGWQPTILPVEGMAKLISDTRCGSVETSSAENDRTKVKNHER